MVDTNVRTRKREARVAGGWYLALALTAPLGLVYVPGKLFVDGDATATAANLRAFAWLMRLGIASELLHQVLFVYLVMALYRLLSPVDQGRAKLMVIFGALMSVPIIFVNVINELGALILVSGAGFLDVFTLAQRDALAFLLLRLHGQGIVVVSLFWGLWLFPFGMLVIRCGFIPRLFGYFLFAAGFAYLASSSTALLAPRHAQLVAQLVMPLQFGELPMIFWLLIRGARS
jgi:hypothetical protein